MTSIGFKCISCKQQSKFKLSSYYIIKQNIIYKIPFNNFKLNRAIYVDGDNLYLGYLFGYQFCNYLLSRYNLYINILYLTRFSYWSIA